MESLLSFKKDIAFFLSQLFYVSKCGYRENLPIVTKKFGLLLFVSGPVKYLYGFFVLVN